MKVTLRTGVLLFMGLSALGFLLILANMLHLGFCGSKLEMQTKLHAHELSRMQAEVTQSTDRIATLERDSQSLRDQIRNLKAAGKRPSSRPTFADPIEPSFPPPDDLPHDRPSGTPSPPTGVNTVTRVNAPPGTPVIVFAARRTTELKRTIDALLDVRPEGAPFPIFVSQDGDHPGVADVIQSFRSQGIVHLRHAYQEDPTDKTLPRFGGGMGYLLIAHHYKFGLGKLFDDLGYERVIIVEDDMLFAPDFFSYFATVAPILDKDETLLCASAWNDNGQGRNVFDPKQLHRTDCFPGLGWMMPRRIWTELGARWPHGYWDDWLREPEQRRGRSCIFPEMNRVYTFGENGSSGGLFWEYLSNIRLNTVSVPWQRMDVSYLSPKAAYDSYLKDIIRNGSVTAMERLPTARSLHDPRKPTDAGYFDQVAELPSDLTFNTYVIEYGSQSEMDRLMQIQGLMLDHKAGIPRTSYHGVLFFRRNADVVVLKPNREFKPPYLALPPAW